MYTLPWAEQIAPLMVRPFSMKAPMFSWLQVPAYTPTCSLEALPCQ